MSRFLYQVAFCLACSSLLLIFGNSLQAAHVLFIEYSTVRYELWLVLAVLFASLSLSAIYFANDQPTIPVGLLAISIVQSINACALLSDVQLYLASASFSSIEIALLSSLCAGLLLFLTTLFFQRNRLQTQVTILACFLCTYVFFAILQSAKVAAHSYLITLLLTLLTLYGTTAAYSSIRRHIDGRYMTRASTLGANEPRH